MHIFAVLRKRVNFLASDCNIIFVDRPLLLVHHHSVSKLMQGHVLVCMDIPRQCMKVLYIVYRIIEMEYVIPVLTWSDLQ